MDIINQPKAVEAEAFIEVETEPVLVTKTSHETVDIIDLLDLETRTNDNEAEPQEALDYTFQLPADEEISNHSSDELVISQDGKEPYVEENFLIPEQDNKPAKIVYFSEAQEFYAEEVEIIKSMTISEQIKGLLPALEQVQAEAVQETIELIIEKARELDVVDIQEKEFATEEMEKLCFQLFEYIGIQTDEEVLDQFIKNIINKLQITDGKGIKLTAIEEQGGTHEQKILSYLVLCNLSLLVNQNQPRLAVLGRFALKLNLPQLHAVRHPK